MDTIITYKSNLTAEQKKLVISPEFLSWFGDWRALQKAKTLGGNITGMYKNFFKNNEEEFLFEMAVQANSNEISKNGAIKIAGEELIELALKLYPTAKIGDKFSPAVSKVVDKNGEPLVVYHGFMYNGGAPKKFNEFKKFPAFFSANRKFAEEYAETKSFDAGLDADVDSYACFLNIKKLFDPENKSVIELAKKELPETIKVYHGTMWFLDADVEKDYVIDSMQGIVTVFPDHIAEDILKANVGDVLMEPVSYTQKEEKVLLYKDEDWAYTVDKRTFNQKIEWEIAEYVSDNYSTVNSNSPKEIKYNGKRFPVKILNKESYRYEENINNPDYVEFKNKIEERKKYYFDNLLNLIVKEDGGKYLYINIKNPRGYESQIYVKKRNLKTFKARTENNWTMFENETVQKFLTDNDFGGWISFENGDKTYAVYNANSIKLADGTNTTFDENKTDIRYKEGGKLKSEIEDIASTKKLLKDAYKDYLKVNMSQQEISDRAEIVGREAQKKWKESAEYVIDKNRVRGEKERHFDYDGLDHFFTAHHNETKRLEKLNKYITGHPDSLQIYVRAGLPPTNKKGEIVSSTGNYFGQEVFENGVSVFRADYYGKLDYVVIDTGSSSSLTMDYDEASAQKRPLYWVTGEEVGEGNGGEPTLDPKTLKVIGRLGVNNVVNDQYSYAGYTYSGKRMDIHPLDKDSKDYKNGGVININVDVNELGLYSPIEKRILEFKQDRASVNKWKDIVGINSDESKFMGLSDFLNAKKPNETLLKIEILNFIRDNHVELIQVIKNDEKSFSDEIKIKQRPNGTYGIVYNDNPDEFVNDEEYDSEEELRGVYENEDIFSGSDSEYRPKYAKYVLEGNSEKYTELLVMLPDEQQRNRLFYNNLFNILTKQVKERLGIVPDSVKWNTFNLYDYKYKLSNEESLTANELQQLNYIDSLADKKNITFTNNHWDEKNILVHLRFDIREDSDEKKVLFINELQSDWGQQGKKRGFKGKYNINELKSQLVEAEKNYDKLDFVNLKLSEIWDTKEAKLVADLKGKISHEEYMTPLAPFVTDTTKWVKLGLKFAIKQAVLNNCNNLSWTTGEQQNELYDISKSLSKISWWNIGGDDNSWIGDDNGWGITAYDKKDKIVLKESDITLKDIEKFVGKDIAEKIKNHDGYTQTVGQTIYGELTGDNLKLSGSGMIGFYGSIIKNEIGIVGNVLKALVKELTGTKTEINIIEIPQGKGIVGKPTVEQLAKAAQLAKEANDYESVDFLIEQMSRINQGQEYSYGLFNSNVPASHFFDKVREPSIYTQYSIEITPELVSAVEEGMPMFVNGGTLGEKNPYAICTVSLGKAIGTQKRSKWTAAQLKKYEGCVLKVKDTMAKGGGLYTVLYVDKNGKNIVYSDKDGYTIAVNNPDDAKYITLWKDDSRVGVLEARESYLNDYHGHTGKFLTIAAAYVDDGHKNKGYGLKMYQVLQEFSANDVLGFFSDLSNRNNKKVIPRIYSHFNNEIVGDYHIVTYQDGGIIKQSVYFAVYKIENGTEHWVMVGKYDINNDENIDVVRDLVDKITEEKDFKIKAITKKEYEDYDLGDEITIDEAKEFFNKGENQTGKKSDSDDEYRERGGALCECKFKFRDDRVPSQGINEHLLSLRK